MAIQFFLPDGSIVNESGDGAQYFLPDGSIVNEPAALAVASISVDFDFQISTESYVGSASPKQYFLPSGEIFNDSGVGENYFFGQTIVNGGGVVVAQSVSSISVAPSSVTITRGATQNFAVVDQGGVARPGATVASSDTSVATIATPNDSFGISVATASGSNSGLTTLTFTYNNGVSNLTATATLIVQSVATVSGNGTIPITGTVVDIDSVMPVSYSGYLAADHGMPISTFPYVPFSVVAEFDMPISTGGALAFDSDMPISWGQSVNAQFDFPVSTFTTTFKPGNRNIFDILPRN